MTSDPDRDKLAALSARIAKAQKASDPHRDSGDEQRVQVRAWARVMRIGTDFTATILGALGLGWFADETAGTAPWLMVTFLVAGFVMAFVGLVRASGEERKDAAPQTPEKEK